MRPVHEGASVELFQVIPRRWLNDISVGDSLLMEIQNDQSELTSVTNFIRGYLADPASEDEQKVKKLWEKFKSKRLPNSSRVDQLERSNVLT